MENAQFRQVYQALARILPAWYTHAARDLPWRRDCDPYHVWVSEIMLQQTRVEAVRSYYKRFLAAFPNVAALAQAPEEQVLKLWEGLGYYSRARNLQKAARVITETYNGIFPREYTAVRALPGVGDYTAGAICSICFDLPTPAVDGNVLRVCARMCDLEAPVDQTAVRHAVTDNLAAVYPRTGCGTFTQALMELGATVCTPRAWRCAECPVRGFCRAYAAGTVAKRPTRSPKKEKREETRTVLLLYCEGKLAIEKRENRGLLAGMWQLPNVEGMLTLDSALDVARGFGMEPAAPLWVKQRVHVFTHIRWKMYGYAITCRACSGEFVWATPAQLDSIYALPTAFRQFLEDMPE